jgi:dTDP-4-dehydrorhamnose reductase
VTILRRAAEGKPLRVVNDQVVSPTYAFDLARKVTDLIKTDAYGLYHVSNHGGCSWFEFAERMFKIAGVKADLTPTTSETFNAPARRPAYSVLSNHRLQQLGLDDMPTWDNALERFVSELKKSGDQSLGLA